MASEKLKIDARRRKILAILNRDGQVRVTELSRELERALGPAANGEGRSGLRRLFADAVTPAGW